MNKKSVFIIVAAVLVLAAGIYCVAVTGSESPREDPKPRVVKGKFIKNKGKIHKKRLKGVESEKIDEGEVKREKPVLLKEDDEAALSAEMKEIIASLQKALDDEDRKGVSKIASKIQDLIAKGGQEAVPVSVRMKAVEAIGWFLPDSLADLVPFMGDSDPDVIDDVMSAFEEALDNISLGDRELSLIVKSVSKALSNDDALDALFFCVESDMRNSVAVDTYKYLMQNGSKECKERILSSIEDFTGEDNITTEGDLDNWLKENPDDEDDEDFYAGEKDSE